MGQIGKIMFKHTVMLKSSSWYHKKDSLVMLNLILQDTDHSNKLGKYHGCWCLVFFVGGRSLEAMVFGGLIEARWWIYAPPANKATIGSDSALSPVCRHVIIWTSDRCILNKTMGIEFQFYFGLKVLCNIGYSKGKDSNISYMIVLQDDVKCISFQTIQHVRVNIANNICLAIWAVSLCNIKRNFDIRVSNRVIW